MTADRAVQTEKLGRFLSNLTDPYSENAKLYLALSYDEWRGGPQERDRAWARHMEWVNANVIGPPKATDAYTVEQLQKMGMVGLYARPESEQG